MSAGQSSRAKRYKRQWLRASGLLGDADDGQWPAQPSASSSKPQRGISRSIVDSTLAKITQEDDRMWVALACIDAIERRVAPLERDPVLVRHLLVTGLTATQHAQAYSEQVSSAPDDILHLFAARKKLLHFLRMLDVWDRVYGSEADQFTSKWEEATRNEAEGEDNDDYEAWAEIADTTPSPIAPSTLRTPVLDFILSSSVQQVIQIALAAQPLQLVSFLRALPRPLVKDVFVMRLTIVKALITSCVVLNSGGLSVLRFKELLPRISGESEVGLWFDILDSSRESQDFADDAEVEQVLYSRGLGVVDAHKAQLPGETSEPEPQTAQALLSFYKHLVLQVEQQFAAIDAALQLAKLATSPSLGLPQDEDLLRTTEDLQLLSALVYETASSSSTRAWSLKRFREILTESLTDADRATSLALQYLEGSRSHESLIKAAEEGAIPLLEKVAERDAYLHSKSTEEQQAQFKASLVRLLLALTDRGEVHKAAYVLEADGDISRGTLDISDRLRISLAALLGTPSSVPSSAGLQVFDAFVSRTVATADRYEDGSRGSEQASRSLRDVAGAALGHSATSNVPASPSSIYALFSTSQLTDLLVYVEQAHTYQKACRDLSHFSDAASVTVLASLEGRGEEQKRFIVRLVRGFSRSASHVQQYAQLAHALRTANAGQIKAFDELQDQDVAQIIVEAAVRAGDVAMFEQVLQDESIDQLSAEEQEGVIIDAADELYDNSTSANLHKGDMKIAYDLLTSYERRLVDQSGGSQSSVSARVRTLKGFIEATSRLCSFRIASDIHTGSQALLSPIEIRLCTDRLTLVRRLLGSRDDAYRTPDLILDIAQKLCAIPPGPRQDATSVQTPSRSHVENNTLAMLTDAALAQGDYDEAQTSCEKLVANVLALGKRAEQMQAHASTTTAAATMTTQSFEEAKGLAHRTCHQLSKQPDWSDYASRLRWAGFALAFCPLEQMSKYLGVWRQLAQDLESEVQKNPQKALVDELSRGKSRAGFGGLSTIAAGGGGSLGGLSAAIQAHTGGLSAAGLAALSQFGGSLESYAANPLGALLSRAPNVIRPLSSQTNSSHHKTGEYDRSLTTDMARSVSARSAASSSTGANAPQAVPLSPSSSSSRNNLDGHASSGSPLSRAAQLFDGFGTNEGRGRQAPAAAATHSSNRSTPVEGQPGYMDPAERAARAARRFFSGFGA